MIGENYNVICVFGDGALTGGMIYEALNDIGHNATPMILILNDNEMSISKNVGALSRYLSKLRQTKGYQASKIRVHSGLLKLPFGEKIINILKGFKNLIRVNVVESTFFDDLGIEYLGTVDGHDLPSLIKVINVAKTMNKPVIIHAITKKGKGFLPAEEKPQKFHGISSLEDYRPNGKKSPDFSYVAGKTLCSLAKTNDNFVAITAAMPQGVGLDEFSKTYPKRFFDVGICEQHAVTFSAGLSISGITPVFAVYSSFLQRAYDQLLHDVCLQNLHCVFLVDRAGIVGADGETHHGLFDIAYLKSMPNMTILAPSTFSQAEQMIAYAINTHNAPIAIRYPKGNEFNCEHNFKFEPGKINILGDCKENIIITYGRMLRYAYIAKEELKKDNIDVKIIEVPTVFPIPKELVPEMKAAKNIVLIEDHCINGGFCQSVASCAATNSTAAKISIIAFPDEPIVHGKICEIDNHYNINAQQIVIKMKELING